MVPTEQTARSILVDVLGAPAISISRFKTGNHHYVYDCLIAENRSVVVRIATSENRGDMTRAAYCSDLLRPIGVPLPSILARDLDAAFPYLILERLPGTDLIHVIEQLSADQRKCIAETVAHLQDKVAALPPAPRYGFAAVPERTRHALWSDILHAALARSRKRLLAAQLLDPKHVDRVAEAIRRRESWLDRQPAIRFLHDTTTKNVIVHNGKLSGIVDVDDFCFGDPLYAPALTLMSLLKSGGPVDYVEFWLRAARCVCDWKIALYAAVFCITFMSGHGHAFNGNTYPLEPEDEDHYTRLLDRLLAAADDNFPLSVHDLVVPIAASPTPSL